MKRSIMVHKRLSFRSPDKGKQAWARPSKAGQSHEAGGYGKKALSCPLPHDKGNVQTGHIGKDSSINNIDKLVIILTNEIVPVGVEVIF
jgi:hypothetical protein